jgi:hypothetical protein
MHQVQHVLVYDHVSFALSPSATMCTLLLSFPHIAKQLMRMLNKISNIWS